MRCVIQRVSEASVTIAEKVKSSIGLGLLVLIGIEEADNDEDIEWLCGKISKLRIFNDEAGVMNCSVMDLNGDILLISQFTLQASTKKGNRPSYLKAAKPDIAIPIYEKFIFQLEKETGKKILTGEFGA
ncbi:MAG: D-tyrosyl-tRNA(Tyr) deacylase, partial [Bacteroidia bacterium]|nr:D-tyrosyl-tRNA(Tyr) deacylase [Bacteroidia bacterium]